VYYLDQEFLGELIEGSIEGENIQGVLTVQLVGEDNGNDLREIIVTMRRTAHQHYESEESSPLIYSRRLEINWKQLLGEQHILHTMREWYQKLPLVEKQRIVTSHILATHTKEEDSKQHLNSDYQTFLDYMSSAFGMFIAFTHMSVDLSETTEALFGDLDYIFLDEDPSPHLFQEKTFRYLEHFARAGQILYPNRRLGNLGLSPPEQSVCSPSLRLQRGGLGRRSNQADENPSSPSVARPLGLQLLGVVVETYIDVLPLIETYNFGREQSLDAQDNSKEDLYSDLVAMHVTIGSLTSNLLRRVEHVTPMLQKMYSEMSIALQSFESTIESYNTRFSDNMQLMDRSTIAHIDKINSTSEFQMQVLHKVVLSGQETLSEARSDLQMMLSEFSTSSLSQIEVSKRELKRDLTAWGQQEIDKLDQRYRALDRELTEKNISAGNRLSSQYQSHLSSLDQELKKSISVSLEELNANLEDNIERLFSIKMQQLESSFSAALTDASASLGTVIDEEIDSAIRKLNLEGRK
jgi:hypothetical protein